MPGPNDHATMPAEPRQLRLAVIGAGRWGRTLIGAFSRQAHIAAVVTRGSGAAERWLEDHLPGTPYTTDLDAVLRDPGIDAAVIATPIATHADLAVEALRNGKHVFVEKPLAMSTEDCDRVIATAREAHRLVMVGYTFLHDSALIELRGRLAEDGPRSIAMAWTKMGTFGEPLVWNLLSHDVAIAMWLTGDDPEELKLDAWQGERTALDRLSLALRFPDAVEVRIAIDRVQETVSKAATVTTRSGAEYRWTAQRLDVREGRNGWRSLHVGVDAPLDREVAAFAQALRRRVTTDDATFARSVTRVLSEVERRVATEVQDRATDVPAS